MVVIINYIPVFIVFISALYVYRVRAANKDGKNKKTVVTCIVALACIYAWSAMQPSYGPKGYVARTSVPEFEQSENEITDRLKKPVPAEERDKNISDKYKEKLPFIDEKKYD